jgi:hypothetical protein
MDPKELKGLFEAYSAVYDEELKDSIEEESLAFIDELSDSELDTVVEEVIDELIEEGYEFNQVQEIFEEVIGEDLELLEEIELVSECLQECGLNEFGAQQVLNDPQYFEVLDSLVESIELTEARRTGRVEPVSKSGKPIAGLKGGAKSAAIRGRQAEKSARDTGVERPSQMKAALKSQSEVADSAKQKLKVATKTAKVSQPKTSSSSDAVKDKTASSAWLKKRRDQRAAKREAASAKAGEQQAKARAKNISNIRKEKVAASAAKDREVQSRARNIRNIRIGKAVRKGIAQAQVGAYNKARQVKQAASDTAAKVSQSAKNKMVVAKRGIKKAVAKVAGKVASAAGKVASRAAGVASKMQEEHDVYDIVMSHLLGEGYADTEEAAEVIMVNMSQEWKDEIINSIG